MTLSALVLPRLLVQVSRLETKTTYWLLTVMWSVGAFGQAPNFEPAAPISAPAQLSPEDLEALAAPIALYPDPLIAAMLPAAVYPVEIVNAARFVANPSNLAAIDDQPWDDNVKAVARFPEVIQYMSENLNWTVDLGDAFTEQPVELMEAIQSLRAKAQSAGTLQTTPEQVVIVTNAVVERTFETQVVYVTNTIVQIMPADPQVIYVPVYNPSVVFAPPPTFVRTAPLITFRPGIRAGVILSNRHVNWYYGGVYYGPGGFPFWGVGRYQYFPPPPGFRPPPFRPRPGWRPPRPGFRPPGFPPPGALPPGRPTPLPIRVRPKPVRPGSGRPRTITRAPNMQDRGWGNRPGPSPGGTGGRPGSSVAVTRPTPLPDNVQPGPGGSRPSAGGSRPGSGGSGPGSSESRPGSSGSRPGSSESRPGSGGSARPSPERRPSSGSGLDDMGNGSGSRDSSRRGASSRQSSGGPRGNRGGSRQ